METFQPNIECLDSKWSPPEPTPFPPSVYVFCLSTAAGVTQSLNESVIAFIFCWGSEPASPQCHFLWFYKERGGGGDTVEKLLLSFR